MDDPVVIVAIVGFFGTLVTALATFSMNYFNTKSEKNKVAKESMEGVLRERILLRDETIQKQEKKIKNLKETVEAQDLVIRELRGGGEYVRDSEQDSRGRIES